MNINLDELKKRYGMDDIRNNPKYHELKAHYQNKEREAETRKAEELEKLKLIRDEMNSQKEGVDIAPLVALTDTWTGSNLMSAYRRPEQDRQKNLMNKFNVQSGIANHADKDADSAYARLRMITEEEKKQEKEMLDRVKLLYGIEDNNDKLDLSKKNLEFNQKKLLQGDKLAKMKINSELLQNEKKSKSENMDKLIKRMDVANMSVKGGRGRVVKNLAELARRGIRTMHRYLEDRENNIFTDKNAADMSTILSSLQLGGHVPGIELIKGTQFETLLGSLRSAVQKIKGEPQEHYKPEIMDNILNQLTNLYTISAQDLSEYQANNRNISKFLIDATEDKLYDQNYGWYYNLDNEGVAKPILKEDEIINKLYDKFGLKKKSFAEVWGGKNNASQKQGSIDDDEYGKMLDEVIKLKSLQKG